MMKAFSTIFWTEFKLSIRDMNIPIFGILFPLVVAVVIGLVAGNAPAYEGAGYDTIAQSFAAFAAIAAIAICATGLMGLPLQVADYRNKKILKRYMITPVPSALLLIVQVSINFVMSMISLASLFAVCRIFWRYRMPDGLISFAPLSISLCCSFPELPFPMR